MNKKTTAFILAVFMALSVAGCSGGNDGNTGGGYTPPPSSDTDTYTPEPTPEPLPSYTFEEIVAVTPTRFSERFDKISVDVSGEKNYYGDISIGRSVLDDTNSTLDGDYALFIVESGTVELRITIGDDGYYSLFDLTGKVAGNGVEYNGELYRHNSKPITSVKRNYERFRQINGLSLLRVDWGRNSGSSEYNYELLAAVITEAEAVRYVQDGTLPKCMQGLTVTGLDEILAPSGLEPGEFENIRAALADFEVETSKGEVIITKYTGTDTEVIIPDSVTSIGDFAFDGCYELTSVTIPDSVTSIGVSAFGYCINLTSVTIGNGLKNIGGLAFSECVKLEKINIPDSVTDIGGAAFQGCKGLTSIVIPDSVTNIGDGAFRVCGFTSVTIGNGVTSIGEGVFEGCGELTSVVIPDSVTKIGNKAFDGCRNLTNVTIPDSVTTISNDSFRRCTSLDEATKQRVLEINSNAIFG